MQINHQWIQEHVAMGEKALNWLEYTPIPHIRVGRILLGVALITAGISHAALRAIHSLFDGQMSTLKREKEGRYLFAHGVLDLGRGIFSLFAMTYGITGIVGSTLALVMYDAFVGRCNFWEEKMDKGIYPINNPDTWKRIETLPLRFQAWLDTPAEDNV